MDLKTLIENALKKAGLPEGWFKLVKAQKEEDVEPAVDGLKSLFSTLQESGKADFAKLMEEVGLKDQLGAHVQSQSDKRVTEALKTHEATVTKKILDKLGMDKLPEDKDKDKDKSGKTGTPEELLASVKDVVTELLKPLAETVEKIQKTSSEKDREQLIKEALGEEKIDLKYAKYVKGDTAEDIKKSITEIKQDLVNKALENARPEKGQLAESGNKMAEALAKEKNKGTAQGDFVGMSKSTQGKGDSS